jgi:hypothetical protein
MEALGWKIEPHETPRIRLVSSYTVAFIFESIAIGDCNERGSNRDLEPILKPA